jgi:two-component system, OmpR family, response regulator VicR
MNQRVLIVEDDVGLSRLLHDNLRFEGFDVRCASDGQEALDRASEFSPDLVLLDLMLPNTGPDGFEVCRTLAHRPERTPIIILTAKAQQQDKVLGLELGADDYVTKPFALEELLARVHAVLRRSQQGQPRITLGDAVIDFQQLRATKRDVELGLTSREFELLRYLADRPGKVVLRDELLRAVWGYQHAPVTRCVDSLVLRLRRKLEDDPHHPRFIRTVHGDGYCLTMTRGR